MSAKTGKRPLRSLTAHEKLDAIRRVHDGESKASVARDIGVPESTLRGWCKNEDKISYLSRQSSPDTDESLDHTKRPRLDEPTNPVPPPPGQPFNLSLKSGPFTAETTESRNGIVDLKIKDTPKATAATTTSISERERNRAELARLSVELGLNRPEMFIPAALNGATTNLNDITTNIGLLTQWNSLLMQQKPVVTTTTTSTNTKKSTVAAQADTSTGTVSSSTLHVDQEPNKAPKHLPKDKQPSVNESVWYWLRTQQSMLGLNGSPTTSTTTAPTTSSTTPTFAGITPDQSSWFWRWYKQFAYGQLQLQAQQTQQPVPDAKPILYQQLTKDQPTTTPPPSPPQPFPDQQNAENLSIRDEKSQHKVRSVLDNLLFNNNNNNNHLSTNNLSRVEAVEHGEKFLRWLEACSEPSVTAMQILQFRSLLNNIRDRKNGDNNKAKVKRK